MINCTVQNIDFNYSGSIVQWTAPQTGSYQITAYGAQGGGDWGFGGSGAIMRGTFHLNQGNVLNILVGGQGAGGGSDYANNYYSPSGGGGSFVAGVDRLPPNDPRLGSGRCPLDGEDKGQGYCKQAHGDPPAGRLAHPTAIGNDQKPARRS